MVAEAKEEEEGRGNEEEGRGNEEEAKEESEEEAQVCEVEMEKFTGVCSSPISAP